MALIQLSDEWSKKPVEWSYLGTFFLPMNRSEKLNGHFFLLSQALCIRQQLLPERSKKTPER